ncbi:MAG: nitroreductase family protein [Deltaproteobacteria bacterium]|nr:MAG: nitroreductase family protein [Deltaproteobacteria bacterium]
MDVFTAIKERRSCRDFLPEPVSEDIIERILEAAIWAPSPLNTQPWEFVVITNEEVKKKILSEAERCRNWAHEKSGWKWLETYQMSFLQSAPVIIAVIGDPKKTGIDMFQEEGSVGYQHACAAAVQNIHLAAHALGLSSLWFTFFDKKPLREILGIDPEKTPLALVCLGKAGAEISKMPRKGVSEKARYIR